MTEVERIYIFFNYIISTYILYYRYTLFNHSAEGSKKPIY